jgi:hypothetical protein
VLLLGNKQWIFVHKPEKFTKYEREITLDKVNKCIEELEELKSKVKRTDMKAGRVYLYHYVEPFISGYGTLIKPLIDGKYLEFPFVRITFYDTEGVNCSAEYQRHTSKWITLKEGTLNECILYINENGEYFY